MDAATEVRLQSDCKIKVGAVLERGGRILGIASNKAGSMGNGHYQYSRHAEARVLVNRNGQGASVYVSRKHGLNGTSLIAKPCIRCQFILYESGVRAVYYTVPGGWEVMRL